MISLDTLENITDALMADDIAKALLLIEGEIEISKEKNQHKQVMRLRTLLRKLADGYPKGDYSTANYRNATQHTLSIGNELYDISRPNKPLSEVVLSKSNQAVVADFLKEWSHRDSLIESGLNPMNRILLYGLPGTGKTKLANAVASSLGYPLMSVYLDELMSSYLGKTGKNIREVFDAANKGKVVLFLDEIDAIAKQRNDSQDIGELKRVVTVFLQNLDKLSAETIVIGATNHDELLDRAIWRRFPVRLNLDIPEYEQRLGLFKLFLGTKHKSVNLKLIAKISEGLSGSEIEEISNKILRTSIIESTKVDFADAIKMVFQHTVEKASNAKKTHWKTEDYEAAQELKNSGFTVREIESLSGIPYTTLKGHIK